MLADPPGVARARDNILKQNSSLYGGISSINLYNDASFGVRSVECFK